MSKPAAKKPADPTPPAAVVTDDAPASLEAFADAVADGGATAEVEGETLDVIALDTTDDTVTDDAAPDADAPAPVDRTRALIDVPVLALGAPGTIAVQDADGTWRAALPGETP